MKSIIFYTSNLLEEPIFSTVQKQIQESGLPIVSCSLKPISLGKNIVFAGEPGIITMTKQILTALEASEGDQVFFAEHDVLYHKSHWDFSIARTDTFYYNTNAWRWDYPRNRLITYDRLMQLSGMCCSRDLAIYHYRKRLDLIEKNGWIEDTKEPQWIRRIGYEPGKSKKRGGFEDNPVEEWKSEFPNIDIRHGGTVTKRKCRLKDFKHQPKNWKETTIEGIPGWSLNLIFKP